MAKWNDQVFRIAELDETTNLMDLNRLGMPIVDGEGLVHVGFPRWFRKRSQMIAGGIKHFSHCIGEWLRAPLEKT